MIEITVECNDIKCMNQWQVEVDEDRIHGNRLAKLVECPKCGRWDSPYIIKEEIAG
jgi:hypothetical protein